MLPNKHTSLCEVIVVVHGLVHFFNISFFVFISVSITHVFLYSCLIYVIHIINIKISIFLIKFKNWCQINSCHFVSLSCVFVLCRHIACIFVLCLYIVF